MTALRLLACFALLSSACVTGLSLEDRKCPCAEGWQCCANANICVVEGALCPASGDGGATPDAAPSISVLVGQPGGPGYADDVGSDARFASPKAITGDGQSTLYIIDDPGASTSSGLIRKLDVTSGRVTTLASGFGRSSPYRMCLSGTDLYFNGTNGTHTGEALLKASTTSGAVSFVAGGGTTTAVAFDGGSYEKPADGAGTTASFLQIDALACDGAGHVFIADGDDPFYAGIRQLDVASGEVTTLLGGQPGDPSVFGSAGRYDPLFGLATDGQGNLYFGLGNTIREFTLSSNTVTTLVTLSTIDVTLQGDVQPFSPAALPSASLAYAEGSGLLLLGGNMLLAVSAGGAIARAGAYSAGSEMGLAGYVDGSSSAAEMSNPLGLWAQGGNTYIADTGNYAIRRSAGDIVSTIAGAGTRAGESDGQLSSASLSAPSSIVSDPAGDLYFVDGDAASGSSTGYPLLRKIADDQMSTVLIDVLGPLAIFEGDLFLSDYINASPNVDMIDLASPSSYVFFASSFFGNPATATFTDGLTGFSVPVGLAVDGAGNVYVADSGVDAVLKITGATALSFSVATHDPAAVVVSKVADGFDAPLVVALDGVGNIYVAEATAVKKIDATTHAVSTVSGAEAGWKAITGLAYDPAGFVYVADPDDHRVRAIRLATGVVSDLAGTAGRQGVKTGALPGGLNYPVGLALLPNGDLAIADEGENVVLVVHAPAHAVAP